MMFTVISATSKHVRIGSITCISYVSILIKLHDGKLSVVGNLLNDTMVTQCQKMAVLLHQFPVSYMYIAHASKRL